MRPAPTGAEPKGPLTTRILLLRVSAAEQRGPLNVSPVRPPRHEDRHGADPERDEDAPIDQARRVCRDNSHDSFSSQLFAAMSVERLLREANQLRRVTYVAST